LNALGFSIETLVDDCLDARDVFNRIIDHVNGVTRLELTPDEITQKLQEHKIIGLRQIPMLFELEACEMPLSWNDLLLAPGITILGADNRHKRNPNFPNKIPPYEFDHYTPHNLRYGIKTPPYFKCRASEIVYFGPH